MEFFGVAIELLLILFLVAIVAGLLDTLAGGGGLISIPALILSGIPPLAALGTNKLQGSMGTATATYMMIKNKRIHWHNVKPLMLTAFCGAILGTIVIQFINTELLSFIIPIVLLSIALYFLISPNLTKDNGKPKISNTRYKNIVVPLIGYYDGMFGPGTGSFFALAGVSCRGHHLLTSTAIAKSLNFATNIASLIIFLISGHIVWVIGLCMMLGQLIGAWLGSHCLFKINPAYLRVIVVIMCSGMLIKYADSMGWFY